MHGDGRPLSPGEVALLRATFADTILYARVRLFPRRWFWPLPRDRAMAPDGHVYLPGRAWRDDFAAPGVPLRAQALLIHEGAHLYQHYALGWPVWLRGAFDRRYDCRLVPGRPFHRYRLEQMGMIAEHHFLLTRGGVPHDLPALYRARDYAGLLPLGGTVPVRSGSIRSD